MSVTVKSREVSLAVMAEDLGEELQEIGLEGLGASWEDWNDERTRLVEGRGRASRSGGRWRILKPACSLHVCSSFEMHTIAALIEH